MKKTLLTMSLLATAPLYAQAPAPAPAAAPVVQAAEQHIAAVCDAAAALPASTDSFILMADIGKTISELAELAGEKLGDDTDSQIIKSIDSAALGISPTLIQDVKAWAPVLGMLSEVESLGELAQLWSAVAETKAPETQAADLVTASQESAKAMLKDARLAPLQLAVSFKGENAATTAAMLRGRLLTECRDAKIPGTVSVKADGTPLPKGEDLADMSGICVDMAVAGEDEELLQAINNTKLYLLTAVRGGSLIISLTSDPALVQIPEKAEDSLMATPKMDAFRPHIGKGLLLAGYESSEAIAAGQSVNLAGMQILTKWVTNTFSALAGEDPNNAAAFKAAAEGAEGILRQLETAAAGTEAPTTFTIRRDKDIHVEMEADAKGASFATARTLLPDAAESANTIFYAQGTKLTAPCPVDAQALCQDAQKVLNGFICSLRGDTRTEAEEAMEQLRSLTPVLEQTCGALQSLDRGFGDVSSLLLTEGKELPVLSWQSSVKDRAALTQGWQQICDVINTVAEMSGEAQEPIMTDTLPIEAAEENGTTYYTLSGDVLPPTEALAPTIALNDSLFVISSNAAAARTLTENHPSGCVRGIDFQLNLAPLARSIRQVAETGDAEDPDTAEVKQWADQLESVTEKVEGIRGYMDIVNNRFRAGVTIIMH